MKKIIFTILISSFCLTAVAKPNYSYTTSQTSTQVPYNTQGAYVNEEITTPISKIGIPEEYLRPQVEEKGLEIVWNEWHAKVRNKIAADVRSSRTPQNHLTYNVMTVDLNRNISNIVIIYIPEKSLVRRGADAYINTEADIYIYVHEVNKYYKARVNDKNLIATSLGNVEKMLASNDMKEREFYTIPHFVYFEPLAEKIQKRQKSSFLKFPVGSKRTSVVVTQGMTDIKWIETSSKYTPDMFDDTERQ